jgi:amidophosphoribosyltransferase
MTRNHYVGRTFIQPTQAIRDFKVKLKFNPMREPLKGKRIVVVDDSIIRGTTSKARVKSLFDVGAKEVHLRVSCPPSKNPCFYGIDFPTPKELIANTLPNVEEIRKYLGLTSLGYLSIEGLLAAVKGDKTHYCTACFSGKYPVDFGREGDKYLFEKNGCG